MQINDLGNIIPLTPQRESSTCEQEWVKCYPVMTSAVAVSIREKIADGLLCCAKFFLKCSLRFIGACASRNSNFEIYTEREPTERKSAPVSPSMIALDTSSRHNYPLLGEI